MTLRNAFENIATESNQDVQSQILDTLLSICSLLASNSARLDLAARQVVRLEYADNTALVYTNSDISDFSGTSGAGVPFGVSSAGLQIIYSHIQVS